MRQPRILILTPFRNEEHSIPYYLKALFNVKYPPKLIDLYWLENDSTDHTRETLRRARPRAPFRSTAYGCKKLIGRVQKNVVGTYWKDLHYGRGRARSWHLIWNKYFLPFIKESTVDYVMPWFADAVPPLNVITEYLKVFKKHRDAGWVGGSMMRRHPRPRRMKEPIASPWPVRLASATKPVKAEITGHVWMMPRAPLVGCEFYYVPRESHFSLIRCLQKKGLYVYYQPSVFIKHVSQDGQIHDHKLQLKK